MFVLHANQATFRLDSLATAELWYEVARLTGAQVELSGPWGFIKSNFDCESCLS